MVLVIHSGHNGSGHAVFRPSWVVRSSLRLSGVAPAHAASNGAGTPLLRDCDTGQDGFGLLTEVTDDVAAQEQLCTPCGMLRWSIDNVVRVLNTMYLIC